MNKVLLILLLTCVVWPCKAQEHHPMPGMGAGKFNYTSFTKPVIKRTADIIAANKGFEQHPELGLLPKNAPCSDCFELIGKRTETSKTYINSDNSGNIYTQTSTAAMHYKKGEQWMNVDRMLHPMDDGSYSAMSQEVPVSISPLGNGHVCLGAGQHQIIYNNKLELIFVDSTGFSTSLGSANWNNHTAGDDGVYVYNAWPGIDIEMRTNRGAVKTNFWIQHALPQYAGGRLLIRDHIESKEALTLKGNSKDTTTGLLEVFNAANEKEFVISAATAFEKDNAALTLRDLRYFIGNDNVLDIEVPGDLLGRASTSYPVIVDPLVFAPTSVTVPGSTYSPAWTTGCAILNPATVPADLTITNVLFTFEYLASGGALMANGSMDFYVGTCRNPALPGWYWYCLDFTPGACGGTNIGLIGDLLPCIPPVNCSAYDLNVTMNFYQNYTPVAPCSDLYITATMPLTITIVGRTLDITIPGTIAPICPGQSITLTSNTVYGKTPYTYSWSPGGATTPSISVTPVATTTYTVVVTDACGFRDTAYKTVIVNPSAPVVGSSSLCIGTSTTLTNSVPGGTWTSGDPSIATVSATGEVTGISTGTTSISYTTPGGCVNTLLVNIVNTPAGITGPTTLCTAASATLSNTTPGGTWSTSAPAIVTITNTGIITALTAGTATITYAMSAACYSTLTVYAFQTPFITGYTTVNPTNCISMDGSITLNGLTPGMLYTVNYLFNGIPAIAVTIVANSTGQVIITSLDGGTYNNILLTTSTGCISNPIPGPIVLTLPSPPSTPTATNNGPLCAGDNILLTANSTTTGVTYNWSGPGGFTSALQNPVIAPAFAGNSGVYYVTATLDGCVSAPGNTIVIIHPIPFITSVTGTNPSVCHAADGTVVLSGLTPGTSYTTTYLANGIAAGPVTAFADASGNVTITGLTAGTYSNFLTSAFGCPSASVGEVVLVDPGAPPIPAATSNAPICEGATLILTATDDESGVMFAWAGPAGFTSTQQTVVIYNTTTSASGTYTVTAYNSSCDRAGTIDIAINPLPVLTNITPSQTVVFGTAVQLYASGATYYTWSPNDGSLSNANINTPIARPISTTTYIVTGMNQWGCIDTAAVTITVNYTDSVMIPTAFTPNGDGLNDIFRISNIKDSRLVSFTVYNRWGEEVYNNQWNIKQGWDGNYKGQSAEMGVYYYLIMVAKANGENVTYKGEMTLIR